MAAPMRVLVTGGAGFIGSHLVRVLLDRGDSVIVVDDLSTGRIENLAGLPDRRLEFREGTVAAQLADGLSDLKLDCIFHLAAAVGVKLVVESPIQCIETNVHETSVALRTAHAHKCRILLASTSEVYGKSDRVPFAEGDDVTYGSTGEPRWSYAYSKAIDEHLGLAWHRDENLEVVVARFFNTVGPRQRGRWGMVLPRFIAAALRGEPLRVHGDGLQERCFVDVRDVAPLLPELLDSKEASGQVVNVGHDEPISIKALAERVVAVLNSSSAIELIDIADDYGREIEDLRRRVPDLGRLRTWTDFVPVIGLDQTILDTAEEIQSRSRA
ncbi:MAG: NAD-dependent epimerase/dehydratase family protein [Planctomycetes bacterium]|nr:NAD-dependent epimerase/dehydratase family protein [Planctomycetota bacterium]MCP4840038.1 NAD-dependent epimerase/dehydratase family protein [Planctomycetota bacterium]